VDPGQRAKAKPIPRRPDGDLPKVDVDELPVSEAIRKLIREGSNSNFNSRSDAVWLVACELVRAGVEPLTIFALLLDPDLKISDHIFDQPDPQHAAWRNANRAKAHIDELADVERQMKKNGEWADWDPFGEKPAGDKHPPEGDAPPNDDPGTLGDDQADAGGSGDAGAGTDDEPGSTGKRPLTVKEWREADIAPLDKLLGELLSTTSRVMIVGPTGLGKTMFGLAIAFRIPQGKDFMHWKCARVGRVLYVDGEMSNRQMKKRIIAEWKRFLFEETGLKASWPQNRPQS